MNSNQELSNTSNKGKTPNRVAKYWKQILGVLVALVVLVGVIVVLSKTKKPASKSDNIGDLSMAPTNTVSPTNKIEQLSEEEKRALEEYQQYCKTYNEVVEAYNVGINKYNNLLEQFALFDFLSFPEPYPEAIALDLDGIPDGWSREQSEKKKAEMEQITASVDGYYSQLIINTYNCVIDEYNLLAKAYDDAVKMSSVEFIDGIPVEVSLKNHITELDENMSLGSYFAKVDIEKELKDNDELAANLLLVQQITNPPEQWVLERLETVEGVLECQPVTLEKDPNQLLGKMGGYTSCVYFSYKEVNQDTVKGNDVVDKGTDCGGAIEVYSNKGDALNRCEYLAQFDDTLLYTGSYAIIGSMVIRTSYKLTNQQQIDLTNKIVKAVTTLSE